MVVLYGFAFSIILSVFYVPADRAVYGLAERLKVRHATVDYESKSLEEQN